MHDEGNLKGLQKIYTLCTKSFVVGGILPPGNPSPECDR
jgi:hypothetical protein